MYVKYIIKFLQKREGKNFMTCLKRMDSHKFIQVFIH